MPFRAITTENHLQRAATELLKTDCVAGNDLLAIGLIAGLRAHGKEIPADYSIVSPEDTLLTEIASPPLTTTHQPVEQLAAITVDSLLRQINNQPALPCQILPPYLTVRSSSACPR